MNFKKIFILATALCCLSFSAFAEVYSKTVTEQAAAGYFKANVPRVVLHTSAARYTAKTNIEAMIDKFRYQAESIGNTEVFYHVTADNASYISLFFESIAHLEGSAHPEKDFHALVLDKQTGQPLPLSSFINVPNLAYLKEQNSFGNVIVTASDGRTRLDNSLVDELKTLPTEYILDRRGNVYLLATEMTVYAAGTPLILLPISNFHAAYVVKG